MSHQPVLLNEVIEHWLISPDGVYFDGTFGRGGHSRALLAKLSGSGKLYAMDCDREAVTAGEILAQQDHRFRIKKGNFTEMDQWVRELDLKGKLSGILLDLGVSSPQLDNLERGFSFRGHNRLDMRMDQDLVMDARIWLNQATQKEIQNVLFQYGEARYSRAIAQAIVTRRKLKPLEYTDELAELISRIVPTKSKNPATRAFQAIRIFINQELENLTKFLDFVLDLLKIHGRLLVITFHSLEEQIVKNFIQQKTNSPSWLPIPAALVEILIKKIGRFKPQDEEINGNIRARSATLTVLEKIK